MNIAIFGGTFDPIHIGHLRAAKAAVRRFRLDRILFVPTGNPPHKSRDPLTPFSHRFAMVTLACAEDRRFVPSLLEAPTPDGRRHYSIHTVRAVKRTLGAKHTLFFLIGVDAFLDLPQWREYRHLLDLVNFIVVSRPGFASGAIREVVAPDLVRQGSSGVRPDTVRLRRAVVRVLDGVKAPVASREIREAIRTGRRISGLVPSLVEQYILKAGLYRAPEARLKRR